MAARERELLPVPYFHVVFTLPKPLAALAFQNKKVIYGMLFQAAAETLAEVAENPRHLGARIGFVAILHTWGQNLMHHPHLHCVVPAGGIALDQSRWVPCRQTKGRKPFFLPVRVLSRVFRGKFIHKLKKAYRRRNLVFVNCLSRLAKSPEFSQMIDRVVETDWVVYAKQPFGGPAQVLKYLSRYTHRVAISNQRLVSMQDGRVTFRWKDYADSSRTKAMTLTGCEFMRRFLIHTLPAGFTRIRHYGFLANRNRTENIQRCRALLPDANTTSECESREKPSDMNESVLRCPECKTGKMVIVEAIQPERFNLPTPHFPIRHPPLVFDSS